MRTGMLELLGSAASDELLAVSASFLRGIHTTALVRAALDRASAKATPHNIRYMKEK